MASTSNKIGARSKRRDRRRRERAIDGGGGAARCGRQRRRRRGAAEDDERGECELQSGEDREQKIGDVEKRKAASGGCEGCSCGGRSQFGADRPRDAKREERARVVRRRHEPILVERVDEEREKRDAEIRCYSPPPPPRPQPADAHLDDENGESTISATQSRRDRAENAGEKSVRVDEQLAESECIQRVRFQGCLCPEAAASRLHRWRARRLEAACSNKDTLLIVQTVE